MEVITNDFSINGQFATIEDLQDALAGSVVPALRLLDRIEPGFRLLSAYDTYAREVLPSQSLNDLKRLRGFAEFSRLRAMLIDPPYWEDCPQTADSAQYVTTPPRPVPNCMTEALERDAALLSFPEPAFSQPTLPIEKDGVTYALSNVFDQESAAMALLRRGRIGLSQFLLYSRHPREMTGRIRFHQRPGGGYYADEGLASGGLTETAAQTILKDFKAALGCIHRNERNTDLIRSVTHGTFQGRALSYYEFRTKLSDNVPFRIYYFHRKEQIIFLNSYVKKEQEIPGHVKDFTADLIRGVLR